MRTKHFIKKIKKLLKIYFITVGIIFTLITILSLTTIPFWMYYYLGISNYKTDCTPDYIVVLGGGGIPSESGLMRTYKAYQAAVQNPLAKIIIALPGDTLDTTSSIMLMKNEIVSRGIDTQRISLEPNGLNTRMQALIISSTINKQAHIEIITSPEHMYRATHTFLKVGFVNICGNPAFEKAIESSLIYEDEDLGGNEFIYDVGNNLQLRYQFWNHLKYQIIVYREYMAILYYKLKGWI